MVALVESKYDDRIERLGTYSCTHSSASLLDGSRVNTDLYADFNVGVSALGIPVEQIAAEVVATGEYNAAMS